MRRFILVSFDEMINQIEKQAQKIQESTPQDLAYYEKRLSDKLGWKLQKTRNYLNVMYDVNPMSVISILAKEIAIVLDKKYENHISESEEIYFISNVDGKVHRAFKKDIISYRNFACFRTKEDALAARAILNELYEDAFRE